MEIKGFLVDDKRFRKLRNIKVNLFFLMSALFAFAYVTPVGPFLMRRKQTMFQYFEAPLLAYEIVIYSCLVMMVVFIYLKYTVNYKIGQVELTGSNLKIISKKGVQTFLKNELQHFTIQNHYCPI